MATPLVRSDRLVTLVGGACVDPGDLSWALSRAPVLIAADGGARTCLDLGYRPQAVIGDMDSLDSAVAGKLAANRLHHVSEQDSTDFEKCLSRIIAPGVVALGCLGDRLDHSLATLACVARRRSRCFLIGPRDVAFAAPRRVVLDVPLGTRVSLFPFRTVTGHSTGLRWPIDGLDLSPDGRIGTSNVATGQVTLDAEGIVVLLPYDVKDAAFAALFGER